MTNTTKQNKPRVEEKIENEILENFKAILKPDLKRLETEPIGKIIDDWFRLCEKLGLEVIWQDLSDDVLGNRARPIKAVSDSPLKVWQELIKIKQPL